MDKASFSRLIGDLYQYFRYDKFPDMTQINLWYEDVKYIPEKSLESVFKNLKENETIPRNLPKAMRQAYSQVPKQTRVIEYDLYDDPRYPIENLWTALKILENKDNDEFIRYCRSVKMPLQDIERVKNKFNQAISQSEINRLAGMVGEKVGGVPAGDDSIPF